MAIVQAGYPATLEIDYPEGARNRLTCAFRIFVVIPIFIVLATLGSPGAFAAGGSGFAAAAGILFLPVVLMIVFRQKYPRWWFDFNYEFTRFATRVTSFAGLLGDQYPSTDEEQNVHIQFPYPDAQRDLNRWLPLVKWFLAIPHFFLLIFLGIAAFVVTVFAWFAILFTGTYPRGMWDFVVGVMRWGLRVQAYALLLVTDRYPPFSLQP